MLIFLCCLGIIYEWTSVDGLFFPIKVNPPGNQACHQKPDHQRAAGAAWMQLSLHRGLLWSLLQRRRDQHLYGAHGERLFTGSIISWAFLRLWLWNINVFNQYSNSGHFYRTAYSHSFLTTPCCIVTNKWWQRWLEAAEHTISLSLFAILSNKYETLILLLLGKSTVWEKKRLLLHPLSRTRLSNSITKGSRIKKKL